VSVVPGVTATGRRPPGTLLLDQLRYAVVDLWRARVVMIFTVAIPLVWLVVVGFLAGNDAVDPASGVRIMQFVTPMAAAMGIVYAAYPTVAISFAQARESGVLKRVRGTPVPAWMYIAGRIGGAAVFAVASVAIMFVAGVVVYDVQIVARTLLATVVTVLVAVVSFAALGMAVASVATSAAVAQAASIATAVALTFVSGLFTLGGNPPQWMTTLGDVLPLKPVADSLRDQLNPFHAGSGWDVRRLGVVLAWGLVGAVVAARAFRWEPRGAAAHPAHGARPGERSSGEPAASHGSTTTGARAVIGVVTDHRRSPAALVLDQVVAANRSTWRDVGSLFFALAMPVGLYAFMVSTQGDFDLKGMRFSVYFAAGMAVWGAAVVSFMNLPEAVASARDRRVLKRLRGTPLTGWQYLLGRLTVAIWFAVVVTAGVLMVAVLGYGMDLTVAAATRGLLVVVIGTVSMAACGFALAAFVPSARAVGAVGLVVLLPLAFFSDVFIASAPAWMETVGSVFPLRHFQNALAAVWGLPGAPLIGSHLLVLALWAVGAGVVALRFFRWDVRSTT
jgi:ABC-2 type transport system permease protein